MMEQYDETYVYISGYTSETPNANIYRIIRSTDAMTWATIGVIDSYYYDYA